MFHKVLFILKTEMQLNTQFYAQLQRFYYRNDNNDFDLLVTACVIVYVCRYFCFIILFYNKLNKKKNLRIV